MIILTTSGCKGEVNDLKRQIEYLDKTIGNNDLFHDGYRIKGNVVYDNEISTYTYIFDKKNYYLELNNNEVNKYYFLDQGKRYLLLFEAKDKFYKYIDRNEIKDVIMNIFKNLEIEFIFNLKDLYSNVRNNLEIFIDKCNNDKNYECEIEKSFLSKVEFSSHVDIKEDIESKITYLFKKGKILKTTSLFKKGDYFVNKENLYEYGDQKLEIPSMDKYKFNEDLQL